MRIHIVTLFPELISGALGYGVLGRAIAGEILEVAVSNPRDLAEDRHATVDDRPYGGGPGMVLKVEPTRTCLRQAKAALPDGSRSIYLSAQGAPLDHAKVRELAKLPGLLLLAGRYEGVDERLVEGEIDEELSIGDYVVSGGEFPALVVMDAVARLLPGVLGDELSAEQDSFVDGLLDCPHYTRPETVDEESVPDVLLSGNHEDIRRWRRKQALGRTWMRRPDLIEKLILSDEQQELLSEFVAEQKTRPANG
ncbi:MAG: tRNA (guanosine(37)-N1)-methyltransferase TrmD [Gammaproteobacteria bacterium]|nr:tRNA (guanosine(37)-N1)-methyltransferase TrmD [Pseudomonadota bacterium]MCZ6761546.1 tRNA (guanosine(37)-N1)-methyltransferase TrmD [Gammaproteobacteria bacterium]TDJ10467.1 MAG: tRNA (guanosine(37)-N1)-methyltransferase TrmD [Gammaproteobacteria bacterium]